MGDKVRKIEMKFRLRSFFCERCTLYFEHFGHDPVDGACHCCGKPIAEMPMKSDHFLETKKTVTDLMK